MKVWSWRDYIRQGDLQSTTKLVLLNLSLYMNEMGDGCFPSTEQQAIDTGLSERSVCTHLQKAVDAGFLSKKVVGFSGQGWARNGYTASIPENNALKEVQHVNEKALNLLPKGTEPNDIKALNEVQSNTPVNTPINSPSSYGSEFTEYFLVFWEKFPRQRRGNKNGAWKAWKKALRENRATEEEIINGVSRYADSDEVARGYAKGAAAWLNDDRWGNSYDKPRQHTTHEKPSYGSSVIAAAMQAAEECEVREQQGDMSHPQPPTWEGSHRGDDNASVDGAGEAYGALPQPASTSADNYGVSGAFGSGETPCGGSSSPEAQVQGLRPTTEREV